MIKPKICILLNKIKEYNFQILLKKYLPKDKFNVTVTDKFPNKPSIFDLIVPWSYRKLIKNINKLNNIVVIHSSNLPIDKGWSPIYYSIKNNKSYYVMTCILASEDVDLGNIIIRASFKILPQYTAEFLRKVDNEISFMIIKKILKKWPYGKFNTSKQKGKGNYRSRRFPKDNEIKTNKTLNSILPHLRAVESTNPAFFYHKGIKFLIKVFPEKEPNFPKKIKFEYPGLNEFEYFKK